MDTKFQAIILMVHAENLISACARVMVAALCVSVLVYVSVHCTSCYIPAWFIHLKQDDVKFLVGFSVLCGFH